MATEILLLLIIIALIAGVLPKWPYSKSWGYAPMHGFTVLLTIFLLWGLSEGRLFFKSSGKSVRNAGQYEQSAGPDAADSFKYAHR